MSPRRLRAWCFLCAFTVILYLLLSDLSRLAGWISFGMDLLTPFFLGAIIAFILNKVMMVFERRVYARLADHPHSRKAGWIRPLSLLSTYLLLFLLLVVVVGIVVPQLTTSVLTLAGNMNSYLESLGRLGEWLAQELVIPQEIYQKIFQWLSDTAGQLLGFLVDFIPRMLTVLVSFGGSLLTFGVGIVVSIHLLLHKELLLSQLDRLCRAFLPAKWYGRLGEASAIAVTTFGNYVSGQLLDAFLVGVVSVIGLSLLGFPYAMLIGVMMGITNVIPFYGPFIGAVPGVLLLLMINPIQAVWYIVFVVVVQQVDGNIIAPKIIGGSVGLSPLWVLFAVTVGGGIWGIAGMIFGTPLFAVFYTFLARATRSREAKKQALSQEPE